MPPEQVDGEMRAQDQGDELRPGLRAVRLRAVRRSSTSRWPRRKALKEEYFEEFGGVRDFLNAIVAQARTDGYTETILGRRRYLPDLTSDNRQRREMAERMALNAPIQGSAADIIKVAMLNVQQRAEARRRCGSRMLLQVHDELVFEVAPGELETAARAVTDRMNAAYPCASRWRSPWASAAPGRTPGTDGRAAT